jgi:hypothetical protein
MRMKTNLAAVLVITAAATTMAAFEADGPTIAPPGSHPYGAAYEEWGSRWWEWVYSIPAVQSDGGLPNPLFTSGTVDCSYRQARPEGSDRVWFLVGTPFGTSADRSCVVPAGKALLLPMVNAEADNVGFTCCPLAPTPPTYFPFSVLLGFVQGGMDFVGPYVYASIDGVLVSNAPAYRATLREPFSFNVPRVDNLYGMFAAAVPGESWPNTHINPAASDGYYLMLNPLAPGRHVIKFGAAGCPGCSFEITYHITVKPKHD